VIFQIIPSTPKYEALHVTVYIYVKNASTNGNKKKERIKKKTVPGEESGNGLGRE